MMSVVRVFVHYLGQLQKIVSCIEASCAGDASILQARLHPDMLPLVNQIRTTTNFALRGVCPLLARSPVTFDESESSFVALSRQIENTIRYLADIPAAALDNLACGQLPEELNEIQLDDKKSSERELSEPAGFAVVKLPAEQFIQLYILPNFYFHLSMVYAIARSQGVPLSKQDFDGFHQYPGGFSFEVR